ncbi:hypothetical protein Tco_1377996 [Tanacetum coccineum]
MKDSFTSDHWRYRKTKFADLAKGEGQETDIHNHNLLQQNPDKQQGTISKRSYQINWEQQPLPSLPQMRMFSQGTNVQRKVDFYFDDILDKPLQITGTDMPALKTTEMNIPPIDPPSTIIGTLAIAPPLEDIAANLETMSTPASVDTPRAT